MLRISVPFSYSYSSADLTRHCRVRGLLRLEEDELILEFRESFLDYTTGKMEQSETEIRSLSVPLEQIASLEFRRHWLLLGRIVLETHSLRALEGLPNASSGKLVLRVAYRDRDRARELCAAAGSALADQQLRRLGEGSRDLLSG